MKYSIKFNDQPQFYRKSPEQIKNLVKTRKGIAARIEELNMGGDTFFLSINPTKEIQVAVTKHIRGTALADVSVSAVVKDGQAIFTAMSPRDLTLISSLLSAYINTMKPSQ